MKTNEIDFSNTNRTYQLVQSAIIHDTTKNKSNIANAAWSISVLLTLSISDAPSNSTILWKDGCRYVTLYECISHSLLCVPMFRWMYVLLICTYVSLSCLNLNRVYLGWYVTLFDCISFFLSCVGIPIYVCWSVNVSLPLAYGRRYVTTQ